MIRPMRRTCCQLLAAHTQALVPGVDESPARPVAYDPVFDEYTLTTAVPREMREPIRHCPWCGTELAPSQWTRWYIEVKELGLLPDGPLPDRFRTADWWAGDGLRSPPDA
jgi:hypothetical protein